MGHQRRPCKRSAPARRHVRASWRREGHLLRLWRPPLQPGEWRSLGLFAADDGVELEDVLASMPLRVWRTDEVTPLSPHPNDPARQTGRARSHRARTRGHRVPDHVTVAVPAGTASETVDSRERGQADRERELAGQGYLERLWTLPGQERRLGPVAGSRPGRPWTRSWRRCRCHPG